MMRHRALVVALGAMLLADAPAVAGPFFFSTGDVDGLIGTATRPSSAGKIEIESADDFILPLQTRITSATFTGLLVGADVGDIGNVVVEIYRVFPKDSANPPSGNVPTRTNSPSDVAFDSRDLAGATLAVTTQILTGSFTANNSVLNGINKFPNQTTQGEGPITGTEVEFDIDFTMPLDLPADHYFFVPQVELTNADGEFYWLSAPKPIVPPGTPFLPDLQSWIRNEDLAPDWLRIGTDIVGGSPAPTFNAAFSLTGSAVPEPTTLTLLGIGVLGLLVARRRARRAA